jgi:undecaprenyl-diphosphatase
MRNAVRRYLAWVGGHELGVIVAALVVAGGVWGFIHLADEVKEGDTQRFDEWALRSLRKKGNPAEGIGPPALGDAARDVTALGGVTVLTLVTAAVAGYLLLKRAYGAMWLVLGASVGGLVVSSVLKRVIERPRPQIVPHLAYVYTSSFPSGHSMMSAAVYLTLGALLARFVHEKTIKVYFLAIAGLLTILVGVSRVYVGVHYPTDVLGGWVAGLVWALLCWLVARYLQRRGTVEEDVDRNPTEPAEFEVKC